MSTLKGKVAFVTGGTRGMGKAIVERLAKEGAMVAFTYVNSNDSARKIVSEIVQAGGKALAIKADGAIKGAVANAIEEATATFEKIDILVNNAAVSVNGPIETANERTEAYNAQIDVNIRSVAEAVRTAQKYMPDGGRIINIASVGGIRIGGAGMSDYIATKAAVSAYTRGLAWDLAPRKITVNSVEPGATETDMLINADKAIRQHLMNSIPLKRFGLPEEIAGLVNFLAGDEAGYITGSSFKIDGGITA
ncbi:SDR family NAD(P)-dependent oxidoreductase [Chitinophaga sp. S165]|uniref:SDR family NAD(P)-dependent oxidoreductase n=1 Tax=Chitinophaga sp. S165 TaxID=2135462 RepID=UPI000D71BE7B|nr:SDR family oxidoreductase [Chitinophaga sp. S165]PWV46128.1 3-oxoacyl-[acyl-carrier protein] reductase [Chitinophaga sp. S165]